MIISNEYIKYNPLCLCSCIVSFARNIYHLEKWPQILSQAFGVTFASFENIYNEFYDYVMNLYHKKENQYDDYSDIKLNEEILNKHRSAVKIEADKYKNDINNKCTSKNNKLYSEIFNKNKNSHRYQIRGFLDEINKESKEYKENFGINPINTNTNSKYEDIDIKIPSLTAKKNFGFKSI